MNSYIWVNNQE